jgi:hypothetical protein
VVVNIRSTSPYNIIFNALNILVYTDDHGWSQIWEKKRSRVQLILIKLTPTYHL